MNGISEYFSDMTWEAFKVNLVSIVTTYGIKILIALIILVIGLRLIKYLVKLIKKGLERSQIEQSVSTFLLSLTNILLKVFLFVSIAGILGADTTSFVAILGTAGLAIGLALQGSLSNFAGGVLILVLKPFVVGDYIKEDGNNNEGFVEAIDIFYTTLRTRDNKVVVIPNGILSNNSITNYSKKDTRRVDITVGVGYSEHIGKVKEVLYDIIRNNPLVLKEPEAAANVSELADSSVNFLVLVWCKSEDYWTVKIGLLEEIKLRFDQEGINIPFPQMDVHLLK